MSQGCITKVTFSYICKVITTIFWICWEIIKHKCNMAILLQHILAEVNQPMAKYAEHHHCIWTVSVGHRNCRYSPETTRLLTLSYGKQRPLSLPSIFVHTKTVTCSLVFFHPLRKTQSTIGYSSLLFLCEPFWTWCHAWFRQSHPFVVLKSLLSTVAKGLALSLTTAEGIGVSAQLCSEKVMSLLGCFFTALKATSSSCA